MPSHRHRSMRRRNRRRKDAAANAIAGYLTNPRYTRVIYDSPDNSIVRVKYEHGNMAGGCGTTGQGWFLPKYAPPGLEPVIPKSEYMNWAAEVNEQLVRSYPSNSGSACLHIMLQVFNVLVLIYGTLLVSLLVPGAFPTSLIVIPTASILSMIITYKILRSRPRVVFRKVFDSIAENANNRFHRTGVRVVQGRELKEFFGGKNLDPELYMTYLDFRMPNCTVDEDTAWEAAIGDRDQDELTGGSAAGDSESSDDDGSAGGRNTYYAGGQDMTRGRSSSGGNRNAPATAPLLAAVEIDAPVPPPSYYQHK